MSVNVSKPTPELIEVVDSAFFYARRLFHPDDIRYSIRDRFHTNASFSLTDEEAYFLYRLLDAFRKNLLRTIRETPKGLDGYRFATSSQPLTEALLDEIGYSPQEFDTQFFDSL